MGYWGENLNISLDIDFYKRKPRIFMDLIEDLYARKAFDDDVIGAIDHWVGTNKLHKSDSERLQEMALDYVENVIINDKINYYSYSAYYDWGNKVSRQAQQKLAALAARRAVAESQSSWRPGGEYFKGRVSNAHERKRALELANSGKINPLDLLKECLEADFGFINAIAAECSDTGLKHPEVMKVLAGSKRYRFCVMTEKEFKNTSTRRSLMRRLCDDEKLGKKLPCRVTFTLGDLRSLTSDQKFKFIKHYFGPSHFNVTHRPATYGKNVRLEAFTADDMYLSLFPLLTTRYEEISKFMERYKKYFAKKEEKDEQSKSA